MTIAAVAFHRRRADGRQEFHDSVCSPPPVPRRFSLFSGVFSSLLDISPPLSAFPSYIQKTAISPERGHFPSVECWTAFLYLDEARGDLDAQPSGNAPQKDWFLLLFLTRLLLGFEH